MAPSSSTSPALNCSTAPVQLQLQLSQEIQKCIKNVC